MVRDMQRGRYEECLSVCLCMENWACGGVKGMENEGCIPCGEGDSRVQKRFGFSLDPHIPTEVHCYG